MINVCADGSQEAAAGAHRMHIPRRWVVSESQPTNDEEREVAERMDHEG